MKLLRQLVAALAIVALSGCALIQPKASDTARFETLRQATWQLELSLQGQLVGTCSGVMIAPKHFLTAAHCTADGVSLKVGGLDARVAKVSEVADLALLYVDLPCPCVPVAEGRPALDTPVTTVGYPLGLGQVLTEGRIQSLSIPEGLEQETYARFIHLMLVTSPIIFGNSGGPVFALENGEYRVVGIVSAVAIASLGGFIPNVVPHLAFVVRTEVVKAFVQPLQR